MIRPATEQDIPVILDLIKQLAEYERLADRVTATEQRLRDTLFGEVPSFTLTSEAASTGKPLAAAEVVVEEVEGNPGYYTSKFFLRPHYQLEGLTVSLRLVSKLPSAKAA